MSKVVQLQMVMGIKKPSFWRKPVCFNTQQEKGKLKQQYERKKEPNIQTKYTFNTVAKYLHKWNRKK